MKNERYLQLSKIETRQVEKSINGFLADFVPEGAELRGADSGKNRKDQFPRTYAAFAAWKKLTGAEGTEEGFDALDRFIEEHAAGFNKMIGKHTADEFGAFVMFNEAETRLEPVPDGITALVNSIFGCSSGASVLQLGAGDGCYALKSAMEFPGNRYRALCTDKEEAFISAMRSKVMKLENLDLDFDPSDNSCKIDYIFVNNPINPVNEKLIERIYKGPADGEFPQGVSGIWGSVEDVTGGISELKKVAVVMNSGALTAERNRAVRQYLVDRGLVEAVIVLPVKMYVRDWMNPYLLVLSNGNKSVKFFDAREFCQPERFRGQRKNTITDENVGEIIAGMGGESDLCRLVTNANIGRNRYNLSPLGYQADFSSSSVTLGSGVVKSISRGVVLTGKQMDEWVWDVPKGEPCVNPGCMSDGVLHRYLYLNPGYIKQYRDKLKCSAGPGDILITRSGNPFRVAVNRVKDVIVLGNLFVLKVDSKKMNPWYLKCFLESEKGQQELRRVAAGAKTQVLGLESLMDVRVPVQVGTKQAELAKEAEEITKLMEAGYRQIEAQRNRVQELFAAVKRVNQASENRSFEEKGLDSGTAIFKWLQKRGFAIISAVNLSNSDNCVMLKDMTQCCWNAAKKQIRINCSAQTALKLEAASGLKHMDNPAGDRSRPYSFLLYTYQDFVTAAGALRSIPENAAVK